MEYSPELLAAVAVLDKDQPGWWRKVDLGTFSLNNGECVLAQVYGVKKTTETLRLAEKLLGKYESVLIFCAGNGGRLSLRGPDTNTPQWRSLISERQAADSIGSSLFIPDPREEEVEGSDLAQRIVPYTLAAVLDRAEEVQRYDHDEDS